jgi:hypothetical protein
VERLGLLQQLLDVLPDLTAPYSAEVMSALNTRRDMRWSFLEVRGPREAQAAAAAAAAGTAAVVS